MEPPRQFLVGSDPVAFFVPQEILLRHAPYFDGLIAESSKEAQSAEPVHLPADDPAVWKLFLHWLVYDKLPRNDELFNQKTDSTEIKAYDSVFKALAHTWMFADRIDQKPLANHAMDRMCLHLGSNWITTSHCGLSVPKMSVSSQALKSVLHRTRQDSALYRLLIHTITIYVGCSDHDISQYDELFGNEHFSRTMTKSLIAHYKEIYDDSHMEEVLCESQYHV